MQAFIGIETADATKKFLNTARFVSRLSGGRAVNQDNIHLNVRSLGEISDIRPIKKAMDRAFKGKKQFFLGADCIVHLKKFGINWCLLRGDVKMLKKCRESLDRELEYCGYKNKADGYIPHITLTRNGFKNWDNNDIYVEDSMFRVSRVVLYERVVENGEYYNVPLYATNFKKQ